MVLTVEDPVPDVALLLVEVPPPPPQALKISGSAIVRAIWRTQLRVIMLSPIEFGRLTHLQAAVLANRLCLEMRASVRAIPPPDRRFDTTRADVRLTVVLGRWRKRGNFLFPAAESDWESLAPAM